MSTLVGTVIFGERGDRGEGRREVEMRGGQRGRRARE